MGGKRKGSERERKGNGWEGSTEGRKERQAETGNDLESQINQKKRGTSIKRQDDKELEYQNQINKGEETRLRKCTNRNTEAESESRAKGRERKKRREGRRGRTETDQLEGTQAE